MSVICDELVSRWFDLLSAKNTYAGLHYAEPSTMDPTATELTGGGYQRQLVTWVSAGRLLSNGVRLGYSGLSPASVSHVCVYDQPYGGKLLVKVALTSPKLVALSGMYEIPAGELYIRFP